MEIDHQNIVEENDTLRVGMHEILEKLRDFDCEFLLLNVFILNLKNLFFFSINRKMYNKSKHAGKTSLHS